MIIQERIKQFEALAFGMFVHFGLYSVHAKGEWAYNRNSTPEEYAKLFDLFDPVPDWAEELAQTAVSCQTALSASQDQAQRLTELEQENARLRQRLAQAEQDAAAYAALKERTAGMELDAHRRAQAIVDQARAEGQQQRRRNAHQQT